MVQRPGGSELEMEGELGIWGGDYMLCAGVLAQKKNGTITILFFRGVRKGAMQGIGY